MSKKREGDDNWFMLPPQERGALMKSHGELGKTYLVRFYLNSPQVAVA